MAWPSEAGILTVAPTPRRRRRRRSLSGYSGSFAAANLPVTLSTVRLGNLTRITADTDLGGTVYYHWYLDGVLISRGTAEVISVHLDTGDQRRIACVVSQDADFDTDAGAPAGYPTDQTARWIRSTDATVRQYRIERSKAGLGGLSEQELIAKTITALAAWGTWGSWSAVAVISARGDQWEYNQPGGRLDDVSVYRFRAVPIDAAGNDGTATTARPVKSLRNPDAPDFSVAFDSGTTKVTFSAN